MEEEEEQEQEEEEERSLIHKVGMYGLYDNILFSKGGRRSLEASLSGVGSRTSNLTNS